jgi:mRNA-degrading endonuclease YafQ of YafQ-DinJ toxin-antitoxin module
MRHLIWEKAFARALKRAIKKQPALRNEFDQALKLLQQDVFTPSLETHKLKGPLAGRWACSVGYDLRIVFDFVRTEGQGEDDIRLLEIGTHDGSTRRVAVKRTTLAISLSAAYNRPVEGTMEWGVFRH